MTTRQILSLTLLVTTLTLNAASTKEVILSTKQQSNSISTAIANILYKKGIEKDSALEITNTMICENEKLFSVMLKNYTIAMSANHNDVLNTLAQFALHSKKADLTSYSFLIKLTNYANIATIDKEILAILDKVSTNNSLLKGVFA